MDEAELAGILAHEITHVTEKHHLQALSREGALRGWPRSCSRSQMRSNVGGAMSVADAGAGHATCTRAAWTRADEFEADRQGVALAARAGFDPYGLPAVLQQLRTAAPDNPLFALTLATHPPAQQRLEQLEEAMGSASMRSPASRRSVSRSGYGAR